MERIDIDLGKFKIDQLGLENQNFKKYCKNELIRIDIIINKGNS